ncbi:MAG TPA: hypothetical protein VKN99_15260 [Polyangia bacterium]|nr:hypothetical protein [Polyangia bacterium]
MRGTLDKTFALSLLLTLLVPSAAQAVGGRMRTAMAIGQARARLERAGGRTYPTHLGWPVDNAQAGRLGITVGTGLPPRAIPGVYYHETTHEQVGDPFRLVLGPLQSQRAELRADFGAGFKLVRAGYLGTGAPAAYLRFVAQNGSLDHGFGPQRVRATLRGMRAAIASGW